MNASGITERVVLGILISLVLLGAYSAPALGHFAITYYDNYNYDTGQWDAWQAVGTPLDAWDAKYLADGLSGNTVFTDHAFTSIATFDLRGGLFSKDGHATGGEDWNPLQSIGDNVSGQSAHHVFAALFKGLIYLEEGDNLMVASDDDVYVFLDGDTAWGQEVLSVPFISFFGTDSMVVTAAQEGYHTITVKYIERRDVHSGIEITLNGEHLQNAELVIDIKPETLNLKSKGVFTAFIDLPEGYDEQDIDISTVKCEGAPALESVMADDGKLIVKFNREDLVGVSVGDDVELTVTGELTNGTPFAGSDTIRVIEKGGKK